jgi:thiamine-phosphate pyrophosphorylase
VFAQIIDANVNRVAEGLRVIEDYVRFVVSDKTLTDELVRMRKTLNQSSVDLAEHLSIRDSVKDVRAKETPDKRSGLESLLKANFKRVQEGLRVLEEYTGQGLYNSLRYDAYELEKRVLLPLIKPQIVSGVYYISDEEDKLFQALEWGVSLIQLRGKDLGKEDVLQLAQRIAPVAKEKGIPFIVNDYLDIALLVDADGLHTGQDDLSVSEQRKIFGEHKIIGRTTHTLEQGLSAEKEGADYVSVGPIWETPSKPGRDGIGFDYLSKAQSQLSIPFVAIGGVNSENLSDLLSFNPPLIGLIRDFDRIPDIQSQLSQ